MSIRVQRPHDQMKRSRVDGSVSRRKRTTGDRGFESALTSHIALLRAETARWELLDRPGVCRRRGLAALKTRKIAVPVAPAPSERAPARACGSWPFFWL